MIKRIIEAINDCGTFLITSHVRLDGDALGSELALYSVLLKMKKEALIYNQDETPEHYRFLPESSTIVHELPDLSRYDAVFVLDCNSLSRIGREGVKIGAMQNIINIDHHITDDGFCELTFMDRKVSSTAELLYRLFQAMDCDLTKDAATNLYAAILTDTGGFRYGNTGRDTLVAAGDLVGKGADPQYISENIYENDPPVKIKLLAKVLETLRFDLEGKVGSIVVTQDALASTGALHEHTEGFVDLPRSVRGVEVAILFSEIAGSLFKASLRSKGQFDVEKIARAFGGGGHANAAACRMEGSITAIKDRILRMIEARI
jgi:phosphoesterase RecJ-like protein